MRKKAKASPVLPGFGFCHEILAANHTLIGGCTGSGKSVLLADILWTLAGYDARYNRMVLIDLKRVELARWRALPHVLDSVTESEEVIPLLDWLLGIMDYRYKDMQKKGLVKSDMANIWVIIDEFAQVLLIPGAEKRLIRLGQLARAARIHLVLATQNVSRKGIPAALQQNFTCRVGLACASAIESRQIIEEKGCEDLPDYGFCYIKQGRHKYLQEVPMLEDWEIARRIAIACGKLKKKKLRPGATIGRDPLEEIWTDCAAELQKRA